MSKTHLRPTFLFERVQLCNSDLPFWNICLNYLFLLLLPLLPLPLHAQPASTLRNQAETLFLEAKYEAAYRLLTEFASKKNTANDDPELLTQIAICDWHLNRLDEADSLLVLALASDKFIPVEALLYAAKVQHARLNFEQAVQYYKAFLKKIPQNDPLRASVKDDLRRCGVGLLVRRLPPMAAVINLGEPLNSTADDWAPLRHPDGNSLFFASRRTSGTGCTSGDICAADILVSRFSGGDWGAPASISTHLNTAEHEAPLALTQAGKQLYFFRGKTPRSGDFFTCEMEALTDGGSPVFQKTGYPMRPVEGDCAPFFFHDSLLLFASRRAGGAGGLDVWFSTQSEGRWSEPQNLGSPLNTPYDETSPFLAADGRTLYFSCNDASRSIGGSDVLRSMFFEQNRRWSEPQNMGVPINSAGDDEHFSISPDGTRAFFSSSRKTGRGGRDLYVAVFEAPRTEQASRQSGFPFVSAQSSPAVSETTILSPPKSLRYRVKIPMDQGTIDFAALVQRFPEGENRQSDFLAGSYFSFQSAAELRKDLVGKGYRLAVVAAFLDGQEIYRETAGQWLERFPDLKDFMEH